MKHYHFVNQTPSTNILLAKMIKEGRVEEGTVVHTAFQSEGKGQMGNTWESNNGENLLFSMVLFPKGILPENQFLISQLISIAIVEVLKGYGDSFTVKWPNDIYWKEKKIGGILIENSIQCKKIRNVIVGIGINVNQTSFNSHIPNPVSLKEITNTTHNIELLLRSIHSHIMIVYKNFFASNIRSQYEELLFRKEGFHAFEDKEGIFEAKLTGIALDGRLELETIDGETKSYLFKEVRFI
jgi:BirA family biotin operon repressor/biotin-[acetyl-CoA-carboxylase] ligase